MRLVCGITSALIAFGAGSYILFRLFKKTDTDVTTQLLAVPPPEVIFFTGANVSCRRICLGKKKRSCGPNCSIEKLNHMVGLINNAQKTLDVCIYLITCNELAYAIIRAFKRGTKVRVIVDDEMSTCSESKSRWFVDAGIPVKSKKTSSLMHHKFCVIDYALPERKLLTGSLNWTLQGLAGNYEYVSIISHPVPVLEYQKEFNLLWNDFCIKK